MIDYIDYIIAALNNAYPIGRGIKTRSVPEDLYKFDEKCETISPEKAKIFHNIVADTLYITKKARPYTCTEVAFLITIVRESNKYDWGKLVHVMKYIRGAKDLTLFLI